MLSCSNNRVISVEDIVNQLNEVENNEVYVLVVNTDICYRCIPIYFILIDYFRDNNFSKDQAIFIFNDLREIEQKHFLSKSLLLELDEYTYYFSDKLRNEFQQYYDMQGKDFSLIKKNGTIEISELKKYMSFDDVLITN